MKPQEYYSMPTAAGLFPDIHEILEQGFQECYAICEGLPARLHGRVTGGGPYEIEPQSVEPVLRPILNHLYLAMTRTLFSVLGRIAARRGGPEVINFYFWPGYSSLLLRRSVYYQANPIAGLDEEFNSERGRSGTSRLDDSVSVRISGGIPGDLC
jgi:hypothetical protein